MKFDILTIFPEIISDYCDKSILGRGQHAGAIKIAAHNFRDYTLDKRGHVDDSPYGGGPGMVLQIQPIFDCLKAIGALKFKYNSKTKRLEKKSEVRSPKSEVVIMDPAGKKFDQRMAERFSKLDRLVLVAGRYEGFDARVYKLADERVSVGDYVLAGGELAALAVVEAVSRLIPGVLGNIESLKEETHCLVTCNAKRITPSKGKGCKLQVTSYKKEYPQYTRPLNFMGWKAPKILLSGDHKKIGQWRQKHVHPAQGGAR